MRCPKVNMKSTRQRIGRRKVVALNSILVVLYCMIGVTASQLYNLYGNVYCVAICSLCYKS